MTHVADAAGPLTNEIEKYVRERVALQVDAAVPAVVHREEERRFRQLKWLLALVALVGLGTFGTLSNYLIEKAVDFRLEAKTGNISDSLDFIRFSSVVLKLDLGTSFSSQDRSAVMTYLRRVSRNDRVRHSPEFNAALVQVMKSFAQAGQSSSIDEIYQLYERELLATDSLVEILLHHYGQEMVTRHTVPKNDFVAATFERLESVSAGANSAELALAYRTLFLHLRSPGSANADVQRALDSADLLSESDLARFFREILERTRAENWQRRVSPSGLAFERATRSFLGLYASELARRSGLAADVFRQLQREGVRKDDVEEVADHLAVGVKRQRPAA